MIISKKSVILILISDLILSTAGIGLITYLPDFLDDYLEINNPIIQLIMTIFPLTLFIFPPLLGKYSDKIQNRILFIIFGATGVMLTFFLLIFIQDLMIIIILSFIYGFFGALYRIIFTLYAELVQNDTKYISYYNAMTTGGWFLGSLLGGIFIDIYGIEDLFLFLSIISLMNLIFVVFIRENRMMILDLHKDNINDKSNELKEENSISPSIYYGLFFRNFGLKPIMAVLILIIGFYLSFYAEKGFLIGLNFLIQIPLMLLMGHVITEKNNKYFLMIGYLLSAAAVLGYIFSVNFAGFLIDQILISFSYAMFWSATVIYIAQNSTPTNKGRYMGYANSSTFSGGFLGGIFFSLLLFSFNSNYDIAMYFMIIFPAISVLIIFLKFKPTGKIIPRSKSDRDSEL